MRPMWGYVSQCINVSKNDFRKMSVFNLWSCTMCINSFPFNHIIDNDKFICEIIGHNRLNCDNLIFNPFNDDDISNIKISNFECDPDVHHYDKYSSPGTQVLLIQNISLSVI